MYEELIKRLKSESTLPYSAIKDMRDAADVIEKLTKKYLASEVDNTNLTGLLAEEHAKHMWIPVTERLPEERIQVIVCSGIFAPLMEVAFYDGLWYLAWDGETEIEAVTHWMPLPAPPKEET